MEQSFTNKLADYKALNDIIEERAKNIATKIIKEEMLDPYESDDTAILATSLAKAQGEFPKIKANSSSYYKSKIFADLDNIVHAVKPILEKYDLSVIQSERTTRDGTVFLVTILKHKSGQFTSSRVRVTPANNDPESYGVALAHKQRYSYKTLLNITTIDDPFDDDAESYAKENDKKLIAEPISTSKFVNSYERIAVEQLEQLERNLDGFPRLAKKIMETFGIASLADMPKNKFLSTIDKILHLKEAGK